MSRQIQISAEKESDAAGAKTAIAVPDAQLWSPECPKLYTCRVQFGEDVVEESLLESDVRCLRPSWHADDG